MKGKRYCMGGKGRLCLTERGGKEEKGKREEEKGMGSCV